MRPSFSIKSYSLRAKATFIVVVVVALSLSLVTLINIYQINRLIESEQKRSAEAIVQGLAQAAELPMIVEDNRELDRLLGVFLWNTQIQFLLIYNGSDDLVAKRILDEDAFSSFIQRGDDGGDLIVTHPIIYRYDRSFLGWSSPFLPDDDLQGRRVGRVLVALSLGAVRRDQLQQAFVSLFAAFLAAAVGIVGIFKWIGDWTSRVDGLVVAADAMKRGDFTHRVPPGGTDEVGKLASAFEAMRQAVRQRTLELRELNESLHDQVLERTEKLERAVVEAQTANATKSSFLANMSHEIRTPMNAIIGMVGLSLNKKLSPKLREYLLTVRSSAESLLAIINDILDFSKIEAGKITLEQVDFQLHHLFDKLANLFSDQAVLKDIELVLGIDEGTPVALRGDPLRIEQVFINLLGNAIKFTDQGLIFVHASLESQSGDMVRILFSVRDTGVGIGQKQYESLFEPFTQADGSMTREYGGTGLGLSICRRLVNLHGGKIWVESKPGEGTTVFFTAEFGRQPAAGQIQYVMPASIRGLRCLVIDDNEIARCVAAKMIEGFHFEVDVVSSCGEARECIGGEIGRYDLILVDWRMPEVDGIECVKGFRAMKGSEKVPIIMMTAFGGNQEVLLAKEAGVDYFLTKPLKQSLLFDTIMEIFDYPEAMHASLNARDVRRELVSFEHLSGYRILVAEDNRINQNVAKELLESVGMIVEIATNGQETVDILEKRGKEFDAVLMDVQMPILDGYQATERIRANPFLAELPVIAVTAHAMQGDRERCMQTGMNDYVAKPITPELLFSVLTRWILPDHVETHYREKKGALQLSPGRALLSQSFAGIHIESGLARMAGNMGAYVRMLKDLLEFAREVLERMPQKVVNERDEAIREVHTLKGTAANLSANRLQELCLTLERFLTQSRSTGGRREVLDQETMQIQLNEHLWQINESLTELSETVGELAHLCEGSVEKGEEEALVGADCGESLEILGKLKMMVHECDPMSEEFWIEQKKIFRGQGIDEEMKQMEHNLGNYDFEQSLKWLERCERGLLGRGRCLNNA